MPIVVSDTSPIRAMAHLRQLELIEKLFGRAFVPPAVMVELASPPPGQPGRWRDIPFSNSEYPPMPMRLLKCASVDPGESEAIALALEMRAEVVLMDEARGRGAAAQAGLVPMGVLGILSLAKRRGLISSIRPFTDRLINELRFFVSPRLLQQVLENAGE